MAAADVLIEGNRPGVMERLSLGPADCAAPWRPADRAAHHGRRCQRRAGLGLRHRLRAAPGARERPRAHWCDLLEGSEACFAPVLSIAEAEAHPHNLARGIYSVGAGGALEVTGAPRFRPLSTD